MTLADTINTNSTNSPLGPYRALDLTEGGFNWCGKVLADLGADVIKVEPVGGSPDNVGHLSMTNSIRNAAFSGTPTA